MASNTPNINLYKKDPVVDGNDTFNIKSMLNDNWDKIDEAIGEVNTAISDISIPVKSVNQKTGDVVLTAADVGAETPTGAQTKANTALASAKSYTDDKVADIVNSAPEALDTLHELADALGNDPNFATTVMTEIGKKETPAGAQAKVNALAGEGNTKTVKQLDDELGSHLADYIHHAGYGDANGTNAKTITLDPAPAEYKEGMTIAFKNITQNSGAVTINANGLGAKSILKSNGSALASGNLKANSIYTARYNGTNFILQGEGGSGNATASDLLSGKTASTDAGDIVGTMANRGAVAGTIEVQKGQYIIPEGYHDGSGKVTATYDGIFDRNISAIGSAGSFYDVSKRFFYVDGMDTSRAQQDSDYFLGYYYRIDRTDTNKVRVIKYRESSPNSALETYELTLPHEVGTVLKAKTYYFITTINDWVTYYSYTGAVLARFTIPSLVTYDGVLNKRKDGTIVADGIAVTNNGYFLSCYENEVRKSYFSLSSIDSSFSYTAMLNSRLGISFFKLTNGTYNLYIHSSLSTSQEFFSTIAPVMGAALGLESILQQVLGILVKVAYQEKQVI